MSIERLVRMANDIAAAFSAEPDRDEAIAAIASHLQRFWDPAMRARIREHAASGAAGLSADAVAAIARLPSS